MINRFAILIAVLVLGAAQPAFSAESVPGDSCTGAEENNFMRSGGKEIPTGHFIVCKSGTWRSILSWDAAASVTKFGNLACTSGQVLKFNGTAWACAADASGMAGLPALNSAQIWVGNGSNAATAVTMSGDATLSNAGVLTIGSDAIGSAEITDASIALSDLSATGTASGATYLRGDNTWAPISGADNLGNHIATTVLRSDTHNTDDLGTTAIRWKDGWFQGTVRGGTFAGSGASLTSLPAENLTGTLPAISGVNLTTLNATNITSGTVAAARMPALTGDVTMTAGTTVTNIAADTVGLNELSATGAPSATTYLRGDNTWAELSTAGSVPQGSHCGARSVRCTNNTASYQAPNVPCGGYNITATCSFSQPNVSCPTGYSYENIYVAYSETVAGQMPPTITSTTRTVICTKL